MKRPAFTLIELIVAVAIFATIAVVLYSCFRGGVVSYRRIESEQIFQQKIRRCLSKIEKDFKNMVYMSNIPFEGKSDKVSFVTVLTLADNAKRNIARVSYYIDNSNVSQSIKALTRTEEPLSAAITEASLAEAQPIESDSKESLQLLDSVLTMTFSYLYVSEEETQEAEYQWRELWDAEDVLPLGIKVDITFKNPSDDKEIIISRRIWIPAGRPVTENPEPLPQPEE